MTASSLWAATAFMAAILLYTSVAQPAAEFSCELLAVAEECDELCQYCQMQTLLEEVWTLNGPNWIINEGWPADGVVGNFTPLQHCSWFGIYCCDSDGTLMDEKNLKADPRYAIRYSLTGLTECSVPYGVAVIQLSSNNLNGSLGAGVFSSSALRVSLEYVAMNNNSLDGSLYWGAEAPYLRYLNLDNNRFSGELPPSLFNSSSLNTLSLASNCLTGSIPDLTGLPALSYVDMSHNTLNSTIPATWLDNPNLHYFSAAFNRLHGSIPPPNLNSDRLRNGWPTTWTVLEIRLQGNQLTGLIPPTLGFLQVQVLDVASNSLTGRIDELLTGLNILKEFRVNNNRLTGSLPKLFSSTHIETLSVKYNQLTGDFPESIGQLSDLTEIMIQNNNFSGDFPESMKRLIGLELFTAFQSGLSYQGPPSNRPQDYLPSWLYFDMTPSLYTSNSVYQYLICQPIRVNKTKLPNLASIQVDPSYYHFMGCTCTVGYDLVLAHPGTTNQTKRCVLSVSSLDAHKTVIVASASAVSGFAFLTALLGALFWLLRVHIAAFTLQRAKKRGPPEQGKMVTLVATDVEGSTELWEWDRDAMDAATKVHDRLMRRRLTAFHGYEVNTEGDSFLIAFHEPADAIAWSIAMQQDLLMASWPWQLQHHERTCMRWMANGSSTLGAPSLPETDNTPHASLTTPLESNASLALSDFRVVAEKMTVDLYGRAASLAETPEACAEGPQSEVAFRGLAVRMAIVTGRAEEVTFHSISRRMSYEGEVSKVLKAISDIPHGGQILIDSHTFAAVNSVTADVAKLLQPRPDFDALNKFAKTRHREAGTGTLRVLEPIESGIQLASGTRHLNHSMPRGLSKRPSWRGLEGDWRMPFATSAKDKDTEAAAKMHPIGEREGFLARVWKAFAGWSGRGRQTGWRSSKSMRRPVLSATKRKLLKTDSANSSECLNAEFGQDTSRETCGWLWELLKTRPPRRDAAAEHSAVVIMDMGQHAIKELPEPQMLLQILVPGLEDRAHLMPNVDALEQITFGYFDAPSARMAPLGARLAACVPRPLDPVTLVFCAIEGLAEIKEHGASAVAIAMYTSCVRRLLKKMKGYECQEADSTFMLAFGRPSDAIQFCLLVQEEMMGEVWSEDVLKIKPCRVVYGDRRQRLFQGPRVKMGVYEGVPTRICPHTVSGRADYFGPVVNRAARFCLSAAYGGQIVAPTKTVQKAISEWTQQPCPPLPEAGDPVIVAIKREIVAESYGGFVPQLSPLKSVPLDPLDDQNPEEATRIKSLRVMDWIRSDVAASPEVEASPNVAGASGRLQTPTVSPPPPPSVFSQRLTEAPSRGSEPTTVTLSADSQEIGLLPPHAIAGKTSSGLLAEMQASMMQKLKDRAEGAGSAMSGPPTRGVSHQKPVTPQKSVLGPPTPEERGEACSPTPPRLHTPVKSPFADCAQSVASNGNESQPGSFVAGHKTPQKSVTELQLRPRSASEFSKTMEQTTVQRRRRSAYTVKSSLPDLFRRAQTPSILSVKSVDSEYISVLQSDTWKAVREVEARHIGDMKFKGVSGVHSVMQLNNVQYSDREYPSTPPSNKAETVIPGRGLAYTIILNR